MYATKKLTALLVNSTFLIRDYKLIYSQIDNCGKGFTSGAGYIV